MDTELGPHKNKAEASFYAYSGATDVQLNTRIRKAHLYYLLKRLWQGTM